MDDRDIDIRFGHDELVLRRRYEIASIVNDIMVALWFIIGSTMFFSSATMYPGTWMFLIGSIQLLVRPMIRLARHIHLQRVSGDPHESLFDF